CCPGCATSPARASSSTAATGWTPRRACASPPPSPPAGCATPSRSACACRWPRGPGPRCWPPGRRCPRRSPTACSRRSAAVAGPRASPSARPASPASRPRSAPPTGRSWPRCRCPARSTAWGDAPAPAGPIPCSRRPAAWRSGSPPT
ncbi:MAG: Transcriptional regulator, IclR family, partial [uncultured Actinomycetospora sp.]